MSRPTVTLICLQCNKTYEKDRREHNRQLRRGSKNFCSLSCSKTHTNLTHPSMTQWKGKVVPWLVGGGVKVDKHSPFRYYLRKSSERKKGDTDLDLEYLEQLWQEQNGKCAFTGMPLVLRKHGRYDGRNDSIKTASLDRIDSSKGYVKGNVQFVSAALNMAKQDMDDDTFRKGLRELFEFYSTHHPTYSSFLPTMS
jgi:hypothetical protein